MQIKNNFFIFMKGTSILGRGNDTLFLLISELKMLLKLVPIYDKKGCYCVLNHSILTETLKLK